MALAQRVSSKATGPSVPEAAAQAKAVTARIERNRIVDMEAWRFSLQALRDERPLVQQFGIEIVFAAVELKQAPKTLLLGEIEERAVNTVGTDKALWVSNLARALKLQTPAKYQREEAAIERRWIEAGSHFTTDPEYLRDGEDYATKVLADPNPRRRVAAGRMLVLLATASGGGVKHALSWARAEMSRASGDIRTYWRVVTEAISPKR
ncbi:MAG TPA: hypothetical protein VKT78_04995 [Fimbriimonadaceae bacterium]|nr:hypothetical protein [Fimbriimonadaceae bacterium]